jgi:N-acetylated-alpha-linked acidic dipeptidase
MRHVSLSIVTLAMASLLFAQDQSFRGFLSTQNRSEAEVEQKARAIPDAQLMAKYSDFIASEPHQAGSPRSKKVAEYIQSRLKEWGLATEIETFEVLLPYPTVRLVEVLEPKRYEAKLKEPVVPEDPDSGDQNQLPTFNAYSATGDVTGEAVYVNYGVPGDYEWLAKHGIDVKGKIVIARYGQSWRGIKAKVAAEHGAIACLIYSDPRDDGYFPGNIFPKGPMRPWQGVQRGSVMDMPYYPGDPLTPGWASVAGARRLSRDESKVLVKIPVLPLSYGDAQPILEQLTGPLAPVAWRGGLPFTYHVGPGAAKVHMKTDFDWTNKPIYDVIATIPGNTFPNEWVMAGNHHDAWVNGADDPTSGTVSLLEDARALGALVKQGWSPKRTVKLMFWDSEEFGLIGSTEWVEKHQDELKRTGIAYLNSDSTGRGWLSVSGSHTLEAFITEVAKSVSQPGGNQTLVEAKLHHKPPENSPEPANQKQEKTFTIGALGAGSDYVAFLDYAGIASTNEGLGGMDQSGIYHSVYDSNYWYNHFSDKTRIYGQAFSQFTLTALMRLADAEVAPFEFSHFAQTVTGYLDEIEREAANKGEPLRFPGVRQQLQIMTDNSQKYESALRTLLARTSLDTGRTQELNKTLIETERALIRPDGLPNRSWYKHQIYAPGFYTGYGVKTLPGIREAVDAGQWDLAAQQAKRVAECLDAMNKLIVTAAAQAGGM